MVGNGGYWLGMVEIGWEWLVMVEIGWEWWRYQILTFGNTRMCVHVYMIVHVYSRAYVHRCAYMHAHTYVHARPGQMIADDHRLHQLLQ